MARSAEKSLASAVAATGFGGFKATIAETASKMMTNHVRSEANSDPAEGVDWEATVFVCVLIRTAL